MISLPTSKESKRHEIKVTFADGNVIETAINGTEEEIERYYLGNHFQFGDSEEQPFDYMVAATKVEFIE